LKGAKSKVKFNNKRKKQCSNCGEVKWLKDFYISKAGILGRQSWCMDCQKNQPNKIDYKKLAALYEENKVSSKSMAREIIGRISKLEHNPYALLVSIFIDMHNIDSTASEYFIYKLKKDFEEVANVKELKKVKLKKCDGPTCEGKIRFVEEFASDSTKPDGRQNYCKKCRSYCYKNKWYGNDDKKQTEIEFETLQGNISRDVFYQKQKEVKPTPEEEEELNKCGILPKGSLFELGKGNIPEESTEEKGKRCNYCGELHSEKHMIEWDDDFYCNENCCVEMKNMTTVNANLPVNVIGNISKKDSDYNEYSGVPVTSITLDYPNKGKIEFSKKESCSTCKYFVKDETGLGKGKDVGLCQIQLTNPFAQHLIKKGLEPIHLLYFESTFGCKNHESKIMITKGDV